MKENKGITLVALVVTIIILIILASISINLLIGNDGILTKTRDGKNNYEVAANQEYEALIRGAAYIDEILQTNKSLYATFDTGTNVNVKMKALAGDDISSAEQTVDTKITEIKWSEIEPSEENKQENNIVSTDNSKEQIYMWYDNGKIYIWSATKKLKANTDASNMFGRMYSLKSVDLSYLDTSETTNMTKMFVKDSSLESLDLSKFNTSNVELFDSFIYGCSKLKNLNLDNFVTSKTVKIGSFFTECTSLENLSMQGWNTSNIDSFGSLFYSCSSLKRLDLSEFTTDKVTNMNGMFRNCSSLEELDLSSFNTSKVTGMNGLFQDCSKLKKIYVSENFVTTSVGTGGTFDDQNMFKGATSIEGGAGTTYDSTKIKIEYAKIDGGTSNPGYFTLKSN